MDENIRYNHLQLVIVYKVPVSRIDIINLGSVRILYILKSISKKFIKDFYKRIT